MHTHMHAAAGTYRGSHIGHDAPQYACMRYLNLVTSIMVSLSNAKINASPSEMLGGYCRIIMCEEQVFPCSSRQAMSLQISTPAPFRPHFISNLEVDFTLHRADVTHIASVCSRC